jgi:hypothetical protein
VYSSGPQLNKPKAASASTSPRSTPPPQQTPFSTSQEAKPATPPPAPKPKTPEERAFEIIDGVMAEVRELEATVNTFAGVDKNDKQYRYLEEMLTRSLLKLDSVDTAGQDNIRQARKQAVRMIQAALDLLELKAHANAQNMPEAAMQSTQQSTAMASAPQSMDTSSAVDPTRSSSLPTDVEVDNALASQSRGAQSKEATPMDTEKSQNSGQSSEQSQGQRKDNTRVKEMVLDSEVPC